MASRAVTIFYSTDLVHLPMRCDRDKIQRLYNDMSHKLLGGYQNLAFNYGNIEMFTVYANGGSSRFQLLPDRFRLLEQNSGIRLEDFKARFEVVMRSAASVFGIESFPLHNVKLKMLMQMQIWNDATDFIIKQVGNFDDEDIESFGRYPSAFVMQFSFLATPDEPNTFNVKIEAQDEPRKHLSLEIDGNFSRTVLVDNLSTAVENIQTAHDFLGGKAMSFLNRYDTPKA